MDDNTFNVYTLQMMLQMQFKLSADIVRLASLIMQAYNGEEAVAKVLSRLQTHNCLACSKQ